VRVSDDPISTVERFKRQRASFSCFGMSCGTTLLVLLAIAAAVWFFTVRG
jgi:hypothetical protein